MGNASKPFTGKIRGDLEGGVIAPYQLDLFNARRAAAAAPVADATDGAERASRGRSPDRAASNGLDRAGPPGLAHPADWEAGPPNDGSGLAHAAGLETRQPTARRHAPPPPREEVLPRADSLARKLAADLGARVRLVVNDNRSTMVSYQRESGELTLRLHHMFLDAPEDVIQALADYAGRGKRRAGKVIDAYVAVSEEKIRAASRRPDALQPVGKCFDLQEIFERLNQTHFQDGIRARIGWGRGVTRRRRKSIRLGVYDHSAREIRVHPALDKPDVPLFFVEYIVFHEMLHQLFPSARHDGRHVHHPRAFKDREKAFPLFGVAMAWEKEHLSRLLGR